jgi:hypothetical protein
LTLLLSSSPSCVSTRLGPLSRRVVALLDTSDEALQAACALIPLKRAIMGAQVEVELARGPVGA